MPYTIVVKGTIPEGLVLNLEAPITLTSKGYPGKINLKTEINPIEKVFAGKASAVCLANNHIMDFRSKGLMDTVAALRSIEVPYFGAGINHDNCRNPLILSVGGVTVSLTGYVCASTHGVFCSDTQAGVMPFRMGKVIEDMHTARRNGAQRVIVCLHWGKEEACLPLPDDVARAHTIIDTGADMVIGHHAHCVQMYEIYHGKYIFYGLGNAFFPNLDVPSMFNVEGHAASRYVKRQYYWNQRSLAVTLRPAEMEILVRHVRSDNNTMTWGRPEKPSPFKEVKCNEEYLRTFKKMCLLSLLRGMVFNWLTNPKPPKQAHFKTLLSMLRSGAA